MTVTEAIAAARALTAHDAPDVSVTDAQITQWIDYELKELMRTVGGACSRMMTSSTTSTISTGQTTFAKPSDFDAVYRVSRLEGSVYVPVDRAEELNANISGVRAWRENPTTIEIVPASVAPGSYKLDYLRGPASGYVNLDVPAGFEWVIVSRVAVWIDLRFDENPEVFQAHAETLLKRLLRTSRERDGVHPMPGLRIVRGG